MIDVVLCDWIFYAALCPEVEADKIATRCLAYRELGYNVQKRYHPQHFMKLRYVICFDDEADAALFKLTYL